MSGGDRDVAGFDCKSVLLDGKKKNSRYAALWGQNVDQIRLVVARFDFCLAFGVLFYAEIGGYN